MKPSPDVQSFRLLVVDDLTSIHEDFLKILRPAGSSAELQATAAALFGAGPTPTATNCADYRVDCAHQGQQALHLVEQATAAAQPYALAFVDVRMPPGWDGLETIRHLWAVDPALQIVLCTAYSDHSWNDMTRALGHTDNLIILKKPFDDTEVLQLAHALTRKWQLARENTARVESLDELVRQRTAELRRAQETFTQAFAASPLAQAVMAHDDHQIVAVNAAFERLIGLTAADIVGASPDSFGRGLDPARWRTLIGRLQAGEAIEDYAFVYQPQPSVRREMRASARAVTIGDRPSSVWVIQDVTDRLHLEAQLRQSQKLEAIGQLSAGIAHDFNNLLTGILGYTSELLADPANARLRPLLESINASSRHGAALTRQLLVFSRKQITQIEPVDPTAILATLQPLLRRLIGEKIDLRWDFAAPLPRLLADASALEQIVVNLVLNARDALPNGGRIDVRAGLCEFDRPGESGHPDARAGRFLTLEVSDNGAGIAPEVLPRIFEPFFTTKEVGKGTGLGLSTVYSLVQQHRGWVEVRTTLGQGTTFTVYQPVLENERPAAAPVPRLSSEPPARQFPPIRVLAVDDDKIVRQILRIILTRHNLPNAVAEDGVQAIAEWEKNGPYDLVISDIVMPNDVSGIDLARRLRATHPELPIIFITGYSPDHAGAQNLNLPGRVPRVILKPFAIEALVDAMHDALAPAPAPRAD